MRWSRNWRRAPIGLLAASMVLTLNGCAASDSGALRRRLPALPAWSAPVATPEPNTGEDALTVAARERAAKAAANRRLVEIRDWYAGVRKGYAGDTPNRTRTIETGPATRATR